MTRDTKLIIAVAIGVLTLCNVVLLVQISREKKLNRQLSVMIEDKQYKLDGFTHTQENLQALSNLQQFAENKKVDDVMLYTQSEDSLRLGTLLNADNKFVYYFSENGCSACFEPFIQKLEKQADEIGVENIIVIAGFKGNRNLKSFLKDRVTKLQVYRTTSPLKIFPEDNFYAYAFLLNNTLTAQNVALTDKSNVFITDDYLQLMTKRFKKK